MTEQEKIMIEIKRKIANMKRNDKPETLKSCLTS